MSIDTPSQAATFTEHEADQVERANASGVTPVMFVHGLFLLPSSWDRWAELFEAAGYVALTPGWPDDPDTVAEANAHPEVFAGKGRCATCHVPPLFTEPGWNAHKAAEIGIEQGRRELTHPVGAKICD